MTRVKSKTKPIEDEDEKLDYEEDLSIDPLSLDIEWLEQPNLFFKYSKALADAKKERRLVHKRLLIVQAKLRNEVSGKITGAAMEEESAKLDEWTEFKEARYNEDLLEGAVKSMQQRKNALENLVNLNNTNYFASPKEPRDFSKMNYSAKNVRSRIGSRLNKQED